MLRKIVKHFWATIVVFSVIGGAASFYQLLTAKNEYSLTLYLKSSDKIIENNEHIDGLTLKFDGKSINSLYLVKLQLKNSGRKALTKDFIYKPVQITICRACKLLKLNSNGAHATFRSNTILFGWNLFNPGDVIDVSALVDGPFSIEGVDGRIREVKKIVYEDQVANPSSENRLKNLSLVWPVLILLSFLYTIDAVLLVMKDVKLQNILDFSKSRLAASGISKKQFINEVSKLYEDYYSSSRLIILSPQLFSKFLSNDLSSIDVIDGQNVKFVGEVVARNAMSGNMYHIRTLGLALGPLAFAFCLVKLVVYFF